MVTQPNAEQLLERLLDQLPELDKLPELERAWGLELHNELELLYRHQQERKRLREERQHLQQELQKLEERGVNLHQKLEKLPEPARKRRPIQVKIERLRERQLGLERLLRLQLSREFHTKRDLDWDQDIVREKVQQLLSSIRKNAPQKNPEIAIPPGFRFGRALQIIFGNAAFRRNFAQIYADGNEEWIEAEAAKRHWEVRMIRLRTNLSLLYAAASIIGNKLNALLNPFYQIGKKFPPDDEEPSKNNRVA